MNVVDTIQAMLIEHHVATLTRPLPPLRAVAGDYVVATNGVFKRVARPGLAITVQIHHYQKRIPGLRTLSAGITWQHWPHRLPGDLLVTFLEQARQATSTVPSVCETSRVGAVEYHSVFVYANNGVELLNTTTTATATQVDYTLPEKAKVLLRIHSHHTMPAFFSQQDDEDDEDCSVSAVIGNIFSRQPTLCVRANAYGDRQAIDPRAIFDNLGPFHETTQEDLP